MRTAVLNPAYAYRRVRHYGFGRTAMYFISMLPAAMTRQLIGSIRLVKIASDPLGFAKRKVLARRIVRQSAYKDFFPEKTAFRIAPPGTFDCIDRIIPIAKEVLDSFLSVHPDGHANETPYSYLLCDFRNGPASPDRPIELARNPDFQDLAVSRPLVEIASKYLGEIPILSNISLQVVMPNDKTEGFQKFHIDRVDRRQFKIFIAIEDIDEGNGATMILPADISRQLELEIDYYKGRIADEIVLSPPWSKHLKSATCPAGSAIFFDTCRLVHAGARTRTHRRVLAEIQYISKYAHAEGQAEMGQVIFDKSRARDAIERLLLNA